jgi:hypothetical protein
MKMFLAILTTMALFAVLAASAQTGPNDAMESQIRRGLAIRHDGSLLELRQEKPNEIRHNGLTYSGILVEMAKTDNKFQLINPAAPPEYGTAEDNMVRDPNSRAYRGLKLFSIGF